MMIIQFYKAQETGEIFSLIHPGLYSNSKVEDLDLDKIFKSAESQLETFLSKRVHKRLPEIIDGREPNEFIH